jgi:hypothetical protein
MKKASQLFENYETSVFKTVETNARNEWGKLVGEIVEKINKGRIGTKYKPVNNGMILKKVKGFDTNTLRDFVYECEKSTCFSKCFFGKLKKRVINSPTT